MSEPISKHAALVAEFEAIEDGEAFVAKINEVAPLWPELRGAVADIGARKFEDWHGIVEAWDRAAAKSKALAEQKVIEPEPEEPKPFRRRFTGLAVEEKPLPPELAAIVAAASRVKPRPEPEEPEEESDKVEIEFGEEPGRLPVPVARGQIILPFEAFSPPQIRQIQQNAICGTCQIGERTIQGRKHLELRF